MPAAAPTLTPRPLPPPTPPTYTRFTSSSSILNVTPPLGLLHWVWFSLGWYLQPHPPLRSMFTRELAVRSRGTGVDVFAVHPGERGRERERQRVGLRNAAGGMCMLVWARAWAWA